MKSSFWILRFWSFFILAGDTPYKYYNKVDYKHWRLLGALWLRGPLLQNTLPHSGNQSIPIKPGHFRTKGFTLTEASSDYGLVSKVYTRKENGEVQTDLGKRAVTGVISWQRSHSTQKITLHHHCMKTSRSKAHWPVEQQDLTEKGFQGT